MIVRTRDDNKPFTVMDYLSGKVKFGVSNKSLRAHLADRGLTPDTEYDGCDKNMLRLCYADVLKWLILGPSKSTTLPIQTTVGAIQEAAMS